jgi:hypothetical protein
VRGACARELAALELLEQEVEPRLVLERDVKAHDRWVAQRAEQLLLTVSCASPLMWLFSMVLSA